MTSRLAAALADRYRIERVRGLVALFEGRFNDAIVELRTAWEAMPEDIDVAVWYGLVLSTAGHSDVARAVSQDVAAPAPDHDPTTAIAQFLVFACKGEARRAFASGWLGTLGRASATFDFTVESPVRYA